MEVIVGKDHTWCDFPINQSHGQEGKLKNQPVTYYIFGINVHERVV